MECRDDESSTGIVMTDMLILVAETLEMHHGANGFIIDLTRKMGVRFGLSLVE